MTCYPLYAVLGFFVVGVAIGMAIMSVRLRK